MPVINAFTPATGARGHTVRINVQGDLLSKVVLAYLGIGLGPVPVTVVDDGNCWFELRIPDSIAPGPRTLTLLTATGLAGSGATPFTVT